MRAKVSIFLTVSLMVSLCILTNLALAEEQKPYLVYFEDIVVKPSMGEEHEAAIKEMVAQAIEHDYPCSWYAYSTGDYHYYYAIPMENLTDVDKINSTWGEVAKKLGEEQWKTLMKKYQGTYEYFHLSLIRYLPDQSYLPEEPRVKFEDRKFISMDYYYIKPGYEKEFEELNKEWVALYEKKKSTLGWRVYVGDIGTDMPLNIVILWGKSAADYWSHVEKEHELIGEEGKELRKKERNLIRKFETKTAWFRPDLSYIPKEK